VAASRHPGHAFLIDPFMCLYDAPTLLVAHLQTQGTFDEVLVLPKLAAKFAHLGLIYLSRLAPSAIEQPPTGFSIIANLEEVTLLIVASPPQQKRFGRQGFRPTIMPRLVPAQLTKHGANPVGTVAPDTKNHPAASPTWTVGVVMSLWRY